MAGTKILIVEDKVVTAHHIQSSLQSFGYEAEHMVKTGEEAIEKAEDIKPDLILMDIMLAGEMDGIEAAERIRSLLDVPIIFLTANSNSSVLERAKVTEPFGYLLKPFRSEELRTTIETALYKHLIERRLKESEERLDLALEGADLGTWEINLQTGAAIYDRRSGEMFGYSENEVEPTITGWANLVHPDDVEGVRLALVAHVKGESPRFESEHRIRHRSGEWHWCLARGKTVAFDKSGRALRIIGTNLDVTAVKKVGTLVKKRAEELEVLNAMALAVSKSVTMEEFLGVCRAQIIRLLSTDIVVVYACEGDRLIYQGLGSEVTEVSFQAPREIRFGDCLCGLVASYGKPEYCLNVLVDPRCTSDELKNAGVRSLAALPLLEDNRVLGVLGIASLTERDFSRDAVFLEAVAGQISVGFRNAILHEELIKRVEELSGEIEQRRRAEDL